MLKLFSVLALTIGIFIQALPAYCLTESFQISVTIPPHVMITGNAIPVSSNSNQMVQTQTESRNNRLVVVQSVVVP